MYNPPIVKSKLVVAMEIARYDGIFNDDGNGNAVLWWCVWEEMMGMGESWHAF